MSFFNKLQDHSEVKLTILENYTIPWMRKIVLNPFGKSKCLLMDGFAGPGIYEDGEKGSPIILIEAAIDFFEQAARNRWKSPEIYIFLNELDEQNLNLLVENIKCLGFEEDSDNIFISDVYDTIKIKVDNKEFSSFLTDILDGLPRGRTLIPSFCFVDPFGFSTTPFDLFKRFLENENSELLVNFIYEHTNRFIRHPNEKIREQISTHMGLINLEELISKIDKRTPAERKQLIIETYTDNILNETDATFVRHFDIKKNGKTKMILFYITKNINGLKLIKEVMWEIDGTGQYIYDEKNEFLQLDFDTILKYEKDYHIKVLSEVIYGEFKGKTNISINEVEEFTIIETIYPNKNFLKPALKILESKGIIHNFRGRKKSNSYPDNTIMDFKL